MGKIQITAPSNFTGRTEYGPVVLDFVNGEAVTDKPLNDGHRLYFKRHGYSVEDMPDAEPTDAPESDDQGAEGQGDGDGESAPESAAQGDSVAVTGDDDAAGADAEPAPVKAAPKAAAKPSAAAKPAAKPAAKAGDSK